MKTASFRAADKSIHDSPRIDWTSTAAPTDIVGGHPFQLRSADATSYLKVACKVISATPAKALDNGHSRFAVAAMS